MVVVGQLAWINLGERCGENKSGGGHGVHAILWWVQPTPQVWVLAKCSPLRAAADAFMIDSDKLNADEVFAKVEALCR